MHLYSDVVLAELPTFFLNILEEILEKEGEWSDDKNDHLTKWGIIEATAKSCGWYRPVAEIDRDTAAKMWAIHSWYRPRYDLIAAHSLLITWAVIDSSGPAGTPASNKHFQRLLNSLNDPVEEGYRYGVDLQGTVAWIQVILPCICVTYICDREINKPLQGIILAPMFGAAL